MRLHRVLCEDCGYRTPWTPKPSVATRAARQHRCTPLRPVLAADTAPGTPEDRELLRIARAAVRSVCRYDPDAPPGSSYDETELQSDALLGVTHAVRAWRPDGGASLATYVRLRAIGAVRDGIRDRGIVPRAAYAAGVRVEDLPEQRRRPLSAEALAFHGWSPRVPDFADRVAVTDQLVRALAALPAREQYVVRASVLRGDRLRVIGDELGLTESRVSQVRSAALAKLRETISA